MFNIMMRACARARVGACVGARILLTLGSCAGAVLSVVVGGVGWSGGRVAAVNFGVCVCDFEAGFVLWLPGRVPRSDVGIRNKFSGGVSSSSSFPDGIWPR